MGQKFGGVAMPFFLGVAGFPSNTKSPGLKPTSIPSGILVHPAVWPQRKIAENWELCPFRGGGAGSPCNTMSRRPTSTSVPSGILIHAAVWPHRPGPKIGDSAPFGGRGTAFPSNTKSPGLRSTFHTKSHLDASSRLTTIKWTENWGGALPPF